MPETATLISLLVILLLLHTYVLYPVSLMLLGLLKRHDEAIEPGQQQLPEVTLLVCAYNEEAVIARKISNFHLLDYPPELLRLLIASDGSSDRTWELAQQAAQLDSRISALQLPRAGKAATLNAAMEQVKTSLVIFSDANSMFSPDAVRLLVARFSRSETGCVSGRLLLENPLNSESGHAEGFYWRYETAIKRLESRFGALAGANGAIYAIRTELFRPLPAGTVNDDFLTSMRVLLQSKDAFYLPEATASESVAPSGRSEFLRHVRDASGHFKAILPLSGLLNPLLGMKSYVFWSHRILRWFAPLMLLALFLLTVLNAENEFMRFMLAAQCLFYALALLPLMSRSKLPRAFLVPYYFCNLNLALFIGLVQVLSGRQTHIWNNTRNLK